MIDLTYSTFRKECPAEIRLRASEDGQCLVVRSMNEEHNHEFTIKYVISRY